MNRVILMGVHRGVILGYLKGIYQYSRSWVSPSLMAKIDQNKAKAISAEVLE